MQASFDKIDSLKHHTEFKLRVSFIEVSWKFLLILCLRPCVNFVHFIEDGRGLNKTSFMNCSLDVHTKLVII